MDGRPSPTDTELRAVLLHQDTQQDRLGVQAGTQLRPNESVSACGPDGCDCAHPTPPAHSARVYV